MSSARAAHSREVVGLFWWKKVCQNVFLYIHTVPGLHLFLFVKLLERHCAFRCLSPWPSAPTRGLARCSVHRSRFAMSIVEKIKDIEKEIGRTQINKATMSHLCSLRARLAKLRTELLAPPKGGSADAVGFDVEKVGDARVALIGFPSVGKSTILRRVFSLTHINPCFPICHTPPILPMYTTGTFVSVRLRRQSRRLPRTSSRR